MSDPLDMTGLWHGTYTYPQHVRETLPFVANLTDACGRLSGTIMEPASGEEAFHAEEAEAIISGTRGGRSVDFTKTYRGAIWLHSVDYVGQLSADGRTVTGMWSVAEWDGTFEMHRDLKLEELAEVEERAEVPTSLIPTDRLR